MRYTVPLDQLDALSAFLPYATSRIKRQLDRLAVDVRGTVIGTVIAYRAVLHWECERGTIRVNVGIDWLRWEAWVDANKGPGVPMIDLDAAANPAERR